MMNGLTLLLNAAEQRIQFGVVRDGALLCGQDWAAASQGAELLTPALEAALFRLNMELADFDRIACVHGPGGFTGVRLALTTASALHHALGIPLAGISYLHLLAQSALSFSGQKIRILTHARRELLHRQDFIADETCLAIPLNEPEVVGLSLALDGLSPNDTKPVYLAGSGIARYHELSAPQASGVIPLGEQAASPHWFAFMRLATQAPYKGEDLEPLYLRASEAEDNLEMLAGRRGDSPLEARKALHELLHKQPGSHIA